MTPQLSICIPIYNCGEFIGAALDSALPQLGDNMEIIVYDGGSTDNTAAIMQPYLEAWPQIHYHRGQTRGGIDADMAKTVSLAQGTYCWLFSGDDVMRPGAVRRVMKWIQQGHDVYICKHTICNKGMAVSHEHPVLKPDSFFSVDFSVRNERLAWFRRAVTTEAFFSFMSSLVVRRFLWESGTLPDDFKECCWGHVARLFGLSRTGLRVCYVPEVWLDQRGENDSFSDKGFVNRMRIGIEGYSRLANHFFGFTSQEAFHIRRVLQFEFPLGTFFHAKLMCKATPLIESRPLLNKLMHTVYCDPLLKNLCKISFYYFCSSRFYFILRSIYRSGKPFMKWTQPYVARLVAWVLY